MGSLVGLYEGLPMGDDGFCEGLSDGEKDFFIEGSLVRIFNGLSEGFSDGVLKGASVGIIES